MAPQQSSSESLTDSAKWDEVVDVVVVGSGGGALTAALLAALSLATLILLGLIRV